MAVSIRICASQRMQGWLQLRLVFAHGLQRFCWQVIKEGDGMSIRELGWVSFLSLAEWVAVQRASNANLPCAHIAVGFQNERCSKTYRCGWVSRHAQR